MKGSQHIVVKSARLKYTFVIRRNLMKNRRKCFMCEVAISIPNEVLYDTRMSKGDALAFAKRAVALCYYTQSKVSLGYCAQIADMTKEAFIRYLGENGVSIFQYDDEQEFVEEMNNA